MDKRGVLPELLAPAGNFDKLKTAYRFGADAAYIGGREFSLRAFSDNFTMDEIKRAADFSKELGKRLYVAVNIFAFDEDFRRLPKYIKELGAAGADAVIISDIGLINFVKEFAPALDIHLSTQANVTNAFAARAYAKLGVKRIILSRELSLPQIREMRAALPHDIEFEAFVHGAMCMAYSGRCLLSNYLASRPANRGECAQPCRCEYEIKAASYADKPLTVEEDARGTYIMNSKDLNMLPYLDKLHQAGIVSFKIEGRMKSAYYTAAVVNAYRRALDAYAATMPAYSPDPELPAELEKTGNRTFTEGFYFGAEQKTSRENLASSSAVPPYEFTAEVIETNKRGLLVEMRNKFTVGDTLEILSPDGNFNKTFRVTAIKTEDGEPVTVADKVQQKLYINCPYELHEKDILRKGRRRRRAGHDE